METVWILGGTTEGRQLAAALQGQARCYVSVATAYGASLLADLPGAEVVARRLDQSEMEETIRRLRPRCVVDATHPYASAVTAAAREACKNEGCPYFRILRPAAAGIDCVHVRDFSEALELLEPLEGNIFLTTGSKNLDEFTHISGYAERIALRILPMEHSLQRALELGYAPSHIVCMQGPFSVALNVATWQHFDSKYIVTKDSGKNGGFEEKKAAARQIGAELIVISRSGTDEGEAYMAILQKVRQLFRNI